MTAFWLDMSTIDLSAPSIKTPEPCLLRHASFCGLLSRKVQEAGAPVMGPGVQRAQDVGIGMGMRFDIGTLWWISFK